MKYDILLTEKTETEKAIFRLYRWKPYCISLGANQSYDSINTLKAEQDNLDIVKRPTGGRAILHSEELTYSVIYPITPEFLPRQLYQEINSALRCGLINYHPVFREIELEILQPDFGSFYNQKVSELCFAVSAKSELKFNGKKLVGSAQRKMNKAILQHGSILCGDYHKRIVDYLSYSSEDIEAVSTEIDATTIDIKSILREDVDFETLAESLKSGMEQHFNMNLNTLSKDIREEVSIS